MSDHSKIEWTDATWNPLRGCTKISPGCKHCYAETFAERFRGVSGHPYEQGFDLRLVPGKLTEPFKWSGQIPWSKRPDLRHQSITQMVEAGVECPADRSVFQWPTSNFEILSTPVPCGLGRGSM